jgi:hypothetical protein
MYVYVYCKHTRTHALSRKQSRKDLVAEGVVACERHEVTAHELDSVLYTHTH